MVVAYNPAARYYGGEDGARTVSSRVQERLSAIVTCLETPDEERREAAFQAARQANYYFTVEQSSLSGLVQNFIGSASVLGVSAGAAYYAEKQREYLETEFPEDELNEIMNLKGALFGKIRANLSPFAIAARTRRQVLISYIEAGEDEDKKRQSLDEIIHATDVCRTEWADFEPGQRHYTSFGMFLLKQRTSLLDLGPEYPMASYHRDSGRKKFSIDRLNGVLNDRGELLIELVQQKPQAAAKTGSWWRRHHFPAFGIG